MADNVTPLFPGADLAPAARAPGQISFTRPELTVILGLYGRMVAAGLWRDYALDLGVQTAVFAAFRRASERPDIRIVKNPALARRQGAFALVGQTGAILKRSHDLAPLVRLLERKLFRVID